MKIYHLSNKLALRLKGKAAEFLKAYSTNTLDKPQNAFVNLKGQIVCVFDQMFLSPDKIILVMERPFLERLRTHLKNYLTLMNTTLEEAPDFYLYTDLTGEREPEHGEIYIPQKAGALIGPKEALQANVSDEEFRQFCLENRMPTQGIDFDQELLLCVGDEDYVSYDKGCYLGQEIIARVHYKGKPPKKLVVQKDLVSGKLIGFQWGVNE